MTMNLRSYSVIPVSSRLDDDFSSTMRNRSSGSSGEPFWLNWEIDERFASGGDGGRSDNYASRDPVDLLPNDPFGMDMANSFTAAVIASWVSDRGAYPDYYQAGGGYLMHGFDCQCESALFASAGYQVNYGCACVGGAGDWFSGASECQTVVGAFPGLPVFNEGESSSTKDGEDDEVVRVSGEENGPHEALLYSLAYLDIQDLLNVERVCKFLHSVVQSDSLLWRCIYIGSPLNERITDDDLLRLTRRAQGSLECLSLPGCSKITDDGLKHVLEENPKLKKLSVPGCVRLTFEGLVNNLKAFKCPGMAGITHLRLGRLFSVTQENFEELKLVLGLQRFKGHKLYFYHLRPSSLSCDDECAIDIEICPKCQKVKLVYDCPAESCRGKVPECRGCDVCIARCVQCGRCIENCEYVETFNLENLCAGCWKHPTLCEEATEIALTP